MGALPIKAVTHLYRENQRLRKQIRSLEKDKVNLAEHFKEQTEDLRSDLVEAHDELDKARWELRNRPLPSTVMAKILENAMTHKRYFEALRTWVISRHRYTPEMVEAIVQEILKGDQTPKNPAAL